MHPPPPLSGVYLHFFFFFFLHYSSPPQSLWGGKKKQNKEHNYKTYLYRAASGRAIRVLVYLQRHTPSRRGRVAPPPHLLIPADSLLTHSSFTSTSHPRLDARSLQSWSKPQSHTSKLLFVPSSTPCSHQSTTYNYLIADLFCFSCCRVPSDIFLTPYFTSFDE